MKNSITVALFCLALIGPAHAQLRKCTGPDGRVTYSDVVCSTASKSIQTLAAPAPGGYQMRPDEPPSVASAYEQEIYRKIVGNLAHNEFGRARKLASTTEHLQMISDAEKVYQAAEFERMKMNKFMQRK